MRLGSVRSVTCDAVRTGPGTKWLSLRGRPNPKCQFLDIVCTVPIQRGVLRSTFDSHPSVAPSQNHLLHQFLPIVPSCPRPCQILSRPHDSTRSETRGSRTRQTMVDRHGAPHRPIGSVLRTRCRYPSSGGRGLYGNTITRMACVAHDITFSRCAVPHQHHP